jgi:hypothetical protein
MQWLGYAWILLIVLLTVGGALDDHRDSRQFWYVALGILSGITCAALVAVHFQIVSFSVPSSVLAIASVGAATWVILEVIRDFRALRRSQESSTLLVAVCGLTAAIFLAPAALGLMHACKLRSGAF